VIGQTIGHYRVISKLGAGGMGEVYLARDESLDRSVALKILPPDLVKNDERVRRFIQEAKSASSLNHPHIVTIYEIGEAQIGGRDDDAPAETIHFIAMELVSGHTLKTLIHQEKTDLRTLVRYLAQAADGLAKAHAAGIVHRDLKPENIMVTSDGFAKVVDFGLAKLTETASSGTDLTSAPTELARATGAGVVLGTIGYMSPEQVQGKTVDHRSDIFSLGCVLYEAATRQRPFEADSDVETLHKILKERPPAIEEVNPEVPGELRRLIRRCLAKSPDQRRHAMKDLALDLAEIADEYDTLSASSGSGTHVSSSALGDAPASRKTRTLVAAALAIGVLGLSAAAWSVWRGWTSPAGAGAPLSSMTVTRLMSSADIGEAVLSPDGRQLVYTKEQAGRTTLWMRQLATGSDVQIQIDPAPQNLYQVAFSGDGNYLYFVAAESSRTPAAAAHLYQVPALGGVTRRLAGPFAERGLGGLQPSPDGRLLALTRYDLSTYAGALVVVDIGAGTERTLASFDRDSDLYTVAWSPDGATLAAALDTRTDDRWVTTLVAYTVADGRVTPIGTSRWRFPRSITWLGDGSGFVMAAARETTDERQEPSQLWLVTYPDGEVRRVTNDANQYLSATLSADGTSMVTTQTRDRSTLWMADADRLGEQIQVSLLPEGNIWTLAAAGPSMLFDLEQGNRRAIWTMRVDGTGPRPLTPDTLRAWTPHASFASGTVVFSGNQGGDLPGLWRMDLDGGGLRQLTDGNGEYIRALSPDGSAVLFMKVPDNTTMWRMPTAGGEPVEAFDNLEALGYSPDGQQLLLLRRGPNGDRLGMLALAPAAGGPLTREWQIPPDSYYFTWAPEANTLDFLREVDGVSTLWRMPVGGGEARQILAPSRGSMTEFAWTTDGTRLFYLVRETISRDVILIEHFR